MNDAGFGGKGVNKIILIECSCGTLNTDDHFTCIKCGNQMDKCERTTWIKVPDEVSPQDKKELLIFLHKKLLSCNKVARAIYRKVLTESIDFLDELPEEAKKYSVQAYVDFLREAKKKRQIERLGVEQE